MKTVRLCLLLLLALLLPFRGAVAAAMPCAMVNHGQMTTPELLPQTGDERADPQSMASGHEPAGIDMDMDMAQHSAHSMDGDADHRDGGADHGQHDHGTSSHGDKCNLCSASCALTPLLSAMPTLHPPLALAAAGFPAPAVPGPSFLSDGQERPPRSR
ncbi:MAG: hypothetical protein ABW005_06805 [Burkholderiaceae bacterium]